MNTKSSTSHSMSRFLALLLALTFASVVPGQTKPEPVAPSPNEAPKPKSSRFNLDFPGGTPRELVAAIEKSMGRTINAIIPDEHASVRLPALRMQNVTLSALFNGLQQASAIQRPYYEGGHIQSKQDHMGFFSGDATQGDDSVWYFSRPNYAVGSQPRICRFYPLGEYLAGGLTVDDITTAIQTAWKMLDDGENPTLSFHKETKVLIAVGNPSKLDTLGQALRALEDYQNRGRAAAATRPESKAKQ
jgi:hypothetical protein